MTCRSRWAPRGCAGEALVEDLFAGVGLEPLVLDVGDDQAGAAVVEGEGGQRGRGDVDVPDPDTALGNKFLLNISLVHLCQNVETQTHKILLTTVVSEIKQSPLAG